MHFFFKTNLKMSLFYILDIIGDIGKVAIEVMFSIGTAGRVCMLFIRYEIGTMAQ